jgi:hypothetical protein
MTRTRARTAYRSSSIKRRRASKDEREERTRAIYEIVASIQPCTVRQAFYQAASVHQIVDKTELGYRMVARVLTDLRLNGVMPWHWIADHTRWRTKPNTHDSISDALRETAQFYRRALWRDIDWHVEIWLEKDALRGVIYEITAEFDVPLMIARGYASLSFLHASAELIEHIGKPAFIFHLGDHDPSGVDAAKNIERRLREFAPAAEITFESLAVTAAQIAEWDLPTRPTKQSDSRAKGFGDTSVELDAINPNQLRDLIRRVLQEFIHPYQMNILKAAERSERLLLERWIEERAPRSPFA